MALPNYSENYNRNHPFRLTGMNALPRRFELKWIAGQRGKPGLNADINSATEATREVADPDFELLGTNAASSCSAFNVEGGITLTTTTSSADQVILVPHLDSNQSAWGTVTWGTDRMTEWHAHIRTSSSVANIVLWAGLKLTNTSVIATDNDQVMVRFADADSAYWQVIDSIAGTDVTTTTSFAAAASTEYHIRITIDSDRVARVYINETLVRTTSALTSCDLIPYIGVQTATTGAKAVVVCGQAISREFGAS